MQREEKGRSQSGCGREVREISGGFCQFLPTPPSSFLPPSLPLLFSFSLSLSLPPPHTYTPKLILSFSSSLC